jgi:hypothetical protein
MFRWNHAATPPKSDRYVVAIYDDGVEAKSHYNLQHKAWFKGEILAVADAVFWRECSIEELKE